jgi:uncharacterized protein (UPF0333 family)
MTKKGQAAMEFLMTYGWAILAAVIAIGVLAYFGVFSPGKYVTGNAVVNPPFYVNAHNAKASTGITLEIKNNGGEDYAIQSITVSGCGTYNTLTAIPASDPLKTITIVCDPVLIAGNSFKGDITINYRKTGSLVDLTSTGTIAEKVTA